MFPTAKKERRAMVLGRRDLSRRIMFIPSRIRGMIAPARSLCLGENIGVGTHRGGAHGRHGDASGSHVDLSGCNDARRREAASYSGYRSEVQPDSDLYIGEILILYVAGTG